MMMMMMLIIIIIIIIFPYCYSAYGQPSILFHGQYTISTEEGSQQGDPVGPLLFCNTIQPLLSSLDSDVKLGFLDDVTLGGPVDTVAADVARIAKVWAAIWASRWIHKSVSWLRIRAVPSLTTCFGPSHKSMFVTPLFWVHLCFVAASWIRREVIWPGQWKGWVILNVRMRWSCWIVFQCTQVHLLRTAPSVSHAALQTFDSLSRDSVHIIIITWFIRCWQNSAKYNYEVRPIYIKSR